MVGHLVGQLIVPSMLLQTISAQGRHVQMVLGAHDRSIGSSDKQLPFAGAAPLVEAAPLAGAAPLVEVFFCSPPASLCDFSTPLSMLSHSREAVHDLHSSRQPGSHVLC